MKKLMIAMVVGVAAMAAEAPCNDTTSSLEPAILPTVDELRETGPRQSRWLSLPESRLVINPYNFLEPTRPIDPCRDTALPLHAGYCADGSALRFQNLLMLYKHTGAEPAKVEAGWTDDLRTGSDAWTAGSNASVENVDGSLRVTVHGPQEGCPACGAAERTLEVDLDRTPWLEIDVAAIGDAWALKVTDDGGKTESALQRDTTATGKFTYNVAKVTGWSGKKELTVKFYVIGRELPGTVSSLRFVGFDTPVNVEADSCNTTWTPHMLTASANYGDEEVVATDVLADSDTVLRQFVFSGGQGSTWTLAGKYPGRAKWDRDQRALVLEGTTVTMALVLSEDFEKPDIRFYASDVELVAGARLPSGSMPESAFWSLDFHTSSSTANVAISIMPTPTRSPKRKAFIELEEHWPAALIGNAEAALANGMALAIATQTSRWNHYLQRVPHPAQFELRGIDSLGVTTADVRAAYYKAWVFLHANSLPIMPETGFNYPQVPAGKPSMWGEGHPKARPTASWDSLFAMQMQAYTEPDLAWAAFEGLMTLVDADGRLGGESLPSRKAQTALILHQVGGSTETLRRVYPALKRHLLWARENPRWIHKEHDYPDQKDADFVVSLIIDMRHMARIAEILDEPTEAGFWTDHANRLYADYQKWFWETPTSTPVQIYYAGSGKRSQGNGLWVLSGLALPDLKKDKDRLAGMMRLFEHVYAPQRTFANFYLPKYPEMQFLVLGLHQYGRSKDAAAIVNIAVRDLTRANMFAEQYDIADFPNPDGVRPSAFGAAMLIDFLWMKNGIRMDQGAPASIQLPGEKGSVTGGGARPKL